MPIHRHLSAFNNPFRASSPPPPPPFTIPILSFSPKDPSALPSSSVEDVPGSLQPVFFDPETVLRALSIAGLLVVIGGLFGLICFRVAVVWMVWTRTRHGSPWSLLFTLPFLHPLAHDSHGSSSAGQTPSTDTPAGSGTGGSSQRGEGDTGVDVEPGSAGEAQEQAVFNFGKQVRRGASRQQLAQLVSHTIGPEQEKHECIVCLSDMALGDSATVLLCCNQLFHHQCIKEWLATSGACPLCRRCPFQ